MHEFVEKVKAGEVPLMGWMLTFRDAIHHDTATVEMMHMAKKWILEWIKGKPRNLGGCAVARVTTHVLHALQSRCNHARLLSPMQAQEGGRSLLCAS